MQLAVFGGRRVPAVLFMHLSEGSERALGTSQWVRLTAAVKVDACVSLDQSGCYLQYARLDAVGAWPALFGQQFHAYGAATQHIAALYYGIANSHKRRLERKVFLAF